MIVDSERFFREQKEIALLCNVPFLITISEHLLKSTQKNTRYSHLPHPWGNSGALMTPNTILFSLELKKFQHNSPHPQCLPPLQRTICLLKRFRLLVLSPWEQSEGQAEEATALADEHAFYNEAPQGPKGAP